MDFLTLAGSLLRVAKYCLYFKDALKAMEQHSDFKAVVGCRDESKAMPFKMNVVKKASALFAQVEAG